MVESTYKLCELTFYTLITLLFNALKDENSNFIPGYNQLFVQEAIYLIVNPRQNLLVDPNWRPLLAHIYCTGAILVLNILYS